MSVAAASTSASTIACQHRLIALITQLLGILLLRWWMRFCWRITIRRSPRLPNGPVVYASNHRSFADPPFIAMWSRMPVSFFARSNLWQIPLIRQMLQIFQGIPVDRDQPGMSSMRGAVERLRAGVSVLVFPEGTRTRSGRLGRLRDGPALFSRRAGVPLVPVYVHRSDCIWPRGALIPRLCGPRVEIRIGSPITAPPKLEAREADAWVTARLTAWMHCQERELLGTHSTEHSPGHKA